MDHKKETKQDAENQKALGNMILYQELLGIKGLNKEPAQPLKELRKKTALQHKKPKS